MGTFWGFLLVIWPADTIPSKGAEMLNWLDLLILILSHHHELIMKNLQTLVRIIITVLNSCRLMIVGDY